ncbi:MAG: DUF4340 domain-containing protein [Gemmatimonadota bacterium]|nr:DUF4340 domain-containing protein [Gemmatimonadota bacterium]
MNWKIILILLIVCLGLGGYLYLERSSEPGKHSEKAKLEHMLSFDPEEVERLNIFFVDSLYKVRRRGAQWVMVQPLAGTMADSSLVNHLLRTLNQIYILQAIPADSVNLGQFYLDPPGVSFTVFLESGDSSTVVFGVLNPTTEHIYARKVGEDRVLLIDKTVGPRLRVLKSMVRSKQLVPLPPYSVSRIKYSARAGWSSALERDKTTGQWSVHSAGGTFRANKGRILDLLRLLHGRQVREYLNSSAAGIKQTGLDRPLRSLDVFDEQGSSVALALGNPKQDSRYLLWARLSIYPGELLLVDSSLVNDLDLLKSGNILDLHINDFDPGGLERVELEQSTGKIVLTARNDTLWQVVEPRQAPCRLWQLENLLMHADTMQALEILRPGTGRGFEHPQLRLTISAVGRGIVARMLVGDYRGGNLYIRDDLRGIDFLADSRELEKLSFTLEELANESVRHVVE